MQGNLHWSMGLSQGDLHWPMSLPQRIVAGKMYVIVGVSTARSVSLPQHVAGTCLYAWESPLVSESSSACGWNMSICMGVSIGQ